MSFMALILLLKNIILFVKMRILRIKMEIMILMIFLLIFAMKVILNMRMRFISTQPQYDKAHEYIILPKDFKLNPVIESPYQRYSQNDRHSQSQRFLKC